MLIILFLFILIIIGLKRIILNKLNIIRRLRLFFGGIMNIPFLSTYTSILLLNYGIYLLKNLDQGWIEIMGGQGTINKIILIIGEGDKLNYISLKFYLSIYFLIIITLWMVKYLSSL